MLRGVVYRLIESLASMGHSSIWKLHCAISVCNTLTVGVHISSTHSNSGPGSATGDKSHGMAQMRSCSQALWYLQMSYCMRINGSKGLDEPAQTCNLFRAIAGCSYNVGTWNNIWADI